MIFFSNSTDISISTFVITLNRPRCFIVFVVAFVHLIYGFILLLPLLYILPVFLLLTCRHFHGQVSTVGFHWQGQSFYTTKQFFTLTFWFLFSLSQDAAQFVCVFITQKRQREQERERERTRESVNMGEEKKIYAFFIH